VCVFGRVVCDVWGLRSGMRWRGSGEGGGLCTFFLLFASRVAGGERGDVKETDGRERGREGDETGVVVECWNWDWIGAAERVNGDGDGEDRASY
jgi:hypothetical protein